MLRRLMSDRHLGGLFALVASNLLITVVLTAIYHHGTTVTVLFNLLRGHYMYDSSRFMDQAWVAVQSGQRLYATLFFTRHLKFIYPTSSLLSYPLTTLLHIPSAMFFLVLEHLSLLGTLFLGGEIFLLLLPDGTMTREQRLSARVLVAVLGLLFYPLVYSLLLAQVQTVMTFLWTLAVYFWLRHRRDAAGICIALVCTFKPMLGVFLLWALARKQWRFLGFFLATAGLVQLLAIYVFGWQNAVDYLSVLSYINHRGEVTYANQSVNGLLQRLVHNGDPSQWNELVYPPYRAVVYYGTQITSAALLAFGLFAPALRSGTDRTRDFIVFGMIVTVASPVVWAHHYGYFFAGCLYFLAQHPGRGGGRVYASLVCTLVLSNTWPVFAGGPLVLRLPLDNLQLLAGLGIIGFLASSQANTCPTPSAEF